MRVLRRALTSAPPPALREQTFSGSVGMSQTCHSHTLSRVRTWSVDPSAADARRARQLVRFVSRSQRPFDHDTSSLLAAGIARSPNSHIFIPGDMPFISFLLVAGPCAPTPSTSRETCTLPAFSNSKVIGSLSPFLIGLFKSIIIK